MRMYKSILLIFILAASVTSVAQNRQTSDQIFTQPAVGGGTQWILGIGETITAIVLLNHKTPEAIKISQSNTALLTAQDLPLSESERAAKIKALIANPNNYSFSDDVGKVSQLDEVAAYRLERLRAASIVTKAERDAAIEAAGKGLAEAREAAVVAAQKQGLISKSVSVARRVGGILLLLDVAGRIYVWNALDANPTMSPGAAYINHLLNK